ncbi:hypothetical protein DN069_16650 [Streptacidiphilus pinicola]|uniref:Lipoprotein n=1 Tax=Streptacidiphilus pinicola TaxID=2219663 RepID=A0A2X0IIN1_9ACTN|nr:hypothetical protein [Streptacidiphilus pinicola]RAG84477.1 hypothetical protein DN069_16650 [Streptacidiphilus pinicola]
MRVTRALILTAVLLAGAAGCASSHQVAVEPPASTLGTPFPQRAAQLAASWVGSPTQQTWEAGYVPLDGTTQLPAGAFHSGADKAAYLAGQFHFSVTLPTGPTQQTVHFDSGTRATRPGLSADQALRTEGTGHCPAAGGCPTWLTVTAARATTERVRTSQGPATVPAWAFRIQGYQGEFVFAAVKPETLPNPVDEPRLNGYQGALLESVSADGRTLTLGVATGCGQQPPSGLVYETKDVVVVGATDKPVSMSPGTACPADLRLAPVAVHLNDVLDGRTVINVGSGLPEAPTRG